MNDTPPQPAETRLSNPKPLFLYSKLKVRPMIQALGLTVLFISFAPFLWRLTRFAFHSELSSYILIVPPMVIYLLFLDRKKKAGLEFAPSLPLAAVLLCIAFLALFLSQAEALINGELPESDRLGLPAFALVTFTLGGIVLTKGVRFLQTFAFPLFFLYFLIPMPSWVESMLTHFLQTASAELSYRILMLTGIPVWRDGNIFRLPSLTLEVAEECSGIHSTLVLMITGLLASHLFLKTPWRRASLVLSTLVIGILRNSLRIITLALLTIKLSSGIISGPLHRRGGMLFFILSLVFLFIVLCLLRKSEASIRRPLTPD